ncbi:MAG: hypothetical protein OEV78_01790 [Spirochaetia bacterium]|nr:hypothetical protein [Spirochaetia bacterium]
MSNVITKNRTFGELVELMTEKRNAGDPSAVKRSNFTDFTEINENIEFLENNYLEFASFGYIERLIRKLSSVYGSRKYLLLKILNYNEACGFFSGNLALYLDATDDDSIEEISFTWEGKGEIEKTWDNFTKWEVTKKKKA